MTLVVEDGTAKADAESYVSVADATTYHEAMANDAWRDNANAYTEKQEAALRRATRWIDNTYRNRFQGYRKQGRNQGLEWPRVGVYDQYEPYGEVSQDEVPIEIKRATMEAALRELINPGSLDPDVVRSQIVQSVSVSGAVAVTFAGGSDPSGQKPVLTVIGGILARLLLNTASSSLVGTSERAS